MGSPFVSTWWRTSCLTGPGAKPRPTISGNSGRSSWYSLEILESRVEGEDDDIRGRLTSPSTDTSRWRARLTSNWWWRKKSAPRIGLSTATSVKLQTNRWVEWEVDEKKRGIVRVHQLRIDWPLVAWREAVAESDEWGGKTLTVDKEQPSLHVADVKEAICGPNWWTWSWEQRLCWKWRQHRWRRQWGGEGEDMA